MGTHRDDDDARAQRVRDVDDEARANAWWLLRFIGLVLLIGFGVEYLLAFLVSGNAW